MTTIETSKKRILWLDIARGICIMCMILSHAFSWCEKTPILNILSGTWFLVFFFFCSGLFFSDKKSFKEYIREQAKRLLLPYFVVVFSYLAYRIYNELWIEYSFSQRLYLALVSALNALPADFQYLPFFNAPSIGIGPIWFFVCLFLSTILYKCIYKMRYNLILNILLATLASISQNYITLPFTFQNACIGCMFIALGNHTKNQIFKFVEFLQSMRFIFVVILCFVSFNIHVFFLLKIPNMIVNLGGNVYTMQSIFCSLSGFLFLITLSLVITRSKIFDVFFHLWAKSL